MDQHPSDHSNEPNRSSLEDRSAAVVVVAGSYQPAANHHFLGVYPLVPHSLHDLCLGRTSGRPVVRLPPFDDSDSRGRPSLPASVGEDRLVVKVDASDDWLKGESKPITSRFWADFRKRFT